MAALPGVRAEVARALADALGPFRPQEVVAGIDLALGATGALRPVPGRTKLDAACLGRAPDAAAGAAARIAARLRLDPAPLDALRDDVDACFGGHLVQYLSVGTRSAGGDAMTLYIQPAAAA
jgi:hypothetical protein